MHIRVINDSRLSWHIVVVGTSGVEGLGCGGD